MTLIDLRGQAKLRTSAIGTNYTKAPVAEETDWQARGVCRSGSYDPDMWSPIGRNHAELAELAKDICFDCPVMIMCGAWALEKHEAHGVWGGYSEGDREAIWRGRPVRRRYHRKTLEELQGTA